MDIVSAVPCISMVVKILEHIPFCQELIAVRIEGRAFVDMLSNFEREATLRDSAFR